jgi:cytochrome c oxidase assembly protein subunit 15
VRATGSGAGCGDHWPLCDGQVIPRAESAEQFIEFFHRATSGIALLLVVGMVVWAWRAFPRGHSVRTGAIASLVLIIVEALLGAGLVLLELVATNVSVTRAYWVAAHLANTFLLVGALTLTAWWASGGRPLQLRGQGTLLPLLLIGLLATLAVGSSGAVTALGDTLLQLGALPGGVDQTIDASSHILIQLRIYHPVIAVLTSVYALFLAWYVNQRNPTPTTQRLAMAMVVIFFAELLVGSLNVWLKAPVWMQLFHLLMADFTWMVLVLLSASALAVPAEMLAATRAQGMPNVAQAHHR